MEEQETKKQSKRYNTLKEFEGSKYSGMKVGASHKWNYDQGEWRERKTTPEKWDVYYETTKRRSRRAPQGSGAPVGTEYNWLIVAHQRVEKLDANSYMTCLDGVKFKVAHKRASKDQWNISEKAQRKNVIRFLEQVINELKTADENAEVPYTVGERKRMYGLDLRTQKELREMATAYEVPNRSKMGRKELLEAIKNAHEKQEMARETPAEDKDDHKRTGERPTENVPKILDSQSRNELYQLAAKRHIKGRSAMRKEELVKALRLSRREREKA